MNIAKLSIKRPIFISCLVLLMLITGFISLKSLGVDLFPEINFPIIQIKTVYLGAAPEEIENLISKPLEDEIISITGLKRISSRNMEGVSLVIAEFTLETDIKYAEQQVRDRVALVRPTLPDGIEEPLIKRFDPTDQPILRLAVSADLPPTKLYDLAKEIIKPSIEQVDNVGSVTIIGGSRREIQVELDIHKLNDYELSAATIARKILNSGLNVPAGKYEQDSSEIAFRTIAEFNDLTQLENIPIQFTGDFNSVPLKSVAQVIDGAEDETNRGFLYAPVEDAQSKKTGIWERFFGSGKSIQKKREYKPALLMDIRKQSGANTVYVADGVLAKIDKINKSMKDKEGHPRISRVYDGSKWIRINIKDVVEAILIGIVLAVFVVYLFLGNVRSTVITGLALPNSLLGAFILMYLMGFTINVMTLLALSLTVGLLIDDAIVVRENIFRKLEEGIHPVEAAEIGTTQVALAVVATTLTVVSVFASVGFLKGIIGQFFKQFGLTVVFAMFISLFDAMTVAPMLSAYFAGKMHQSRNTVVKAFDKLQLKLEEYYGIIIDFTLRRPVTIILITTLTFLVSLGTLKMIKKTFIPESDQGEFMVTIEMPPGTSLDGTQKVANLIEEKIKKLPELDLMSTVIGGDQGEPYKSTISLSLLPVSQRKRGSIELKEVVRGLLKDFAYAKPSVSNYTTTGSGSNYPFIMNIAGDNLEELEKYSQKLIERMNKIPDLAEIMTSSQAGKPELQVNLNPKRMQLAGVESGAVGSELRYHVAGAVIGKFHEKGLQYDIRMRLKPEQRNLRKYYSHTRIPNANTQGPPKMIPLGAISTAVEKLGPSYILRQDRSRVIQISANLAKGGGVGNAISQVEEIMKKEIPLPKDMSYSFIGQAESYGELLQNIVVAFILSLIFIYLVLASLYESFITPATILSALPPALSGAFLALFITREMFNIFSMIGVIMLLGLVTKNSILLVDFALEGVRSGMSRNEAIKNAGIIRLRPILMTTFAMIAGTLPTALGWGEAASSRTAMGIAVVGGLLVSTLVTLFVVPALFGYIDRFRESVESRFRPKFEIIPVTTDSIPDPIEEIQPLAEEKPRKGGGKRSPKKGSR